MSETTIGTDETSDLIVFGSTSGSVSYSEAEDTVIVIDREGPAGPRGPQGDSIVGPAGPMGPPGPSDGSAGNGFRFVQSAPTTLWDVHHQLTATRPNVQVTRSDGGLVYGRINYLAVGHLTISFSAAIAGEAYLT